MTEAPPPRRILVCPQEFKGSLTATDAARALAAGVRRARPGAEVRELPMADGGPGTVAIVAAATGGRLQASRVRGPLGDSMEALYALVEDGAAAPLAVIEAAAAAGLVLVPPERRDPARASTHGVGEQVRHTLDLGARRIVVGVGGTGTNDGGAGAAQALGLRLLDAAGHDLPPGGVHLARLERVDASALDPRLADVELRIAVDVGNPLLGPEGATAVYGAQKGVADWLAPALEAALRRWASVLRRDLGLDLAAERGAGAGGGLAVGLLAAVRAAGGSADIEPGAALVGDAVRLRAAVEAADLVLTGEGRLDAQTGYGKCVGYVAELARAAGRPCLAVAGSVEQIPPGILDAEPLAARGVTVEAAMAGAAELAAAAAERLVRRFLGG